MPQTKEQTKELSSIHIGTNGLPAKALAQAGSLQGLSKGKAIELVRKTQQQISNLSVVAERCKKEKKSLIKQIRATKVGMKLTELEDTGSKATKEYKILTQRYDGMLEAFKELGIDIDASNIKMIGDGNGNK